MSQNSGVGTQWSHGGLVLVQWWSYYKLRTLGAVKWLCKSLEFLGEIGVPRVNVLTKVDDHADNVEWCSTRI